MDIEQLKEYITSNIAENEWLDYKKQWHDNNVELIRDIFAFVNTVHEKDCYLIFGVEDDTFNVAGVDKDTNRKNTQQITDMLAGCKIATESPKIKVASISIDGKIIDMLTIFNTTNVPVFLSEEKSYKGKKISPGQIVTRISDTNTPMNRTASDKVVENLYRKRMHLDKTIYERYDYLIEQVNDWTYIDEDQKLIYNYDPDFYIVIKPLDIEEENWLTHDGDYYAWLVESSTFPDDWKIYEYKEVIAMYGQHEIFDLSYFFLFDRARGYTIAPKIGQLGRRNNELTYYYLVKNSRKWKFMTLFIAAWNNHMTLDFYDAYYSSKEIFDKIVVYIDDEERKYVERHYEDIETIKTLEYELNVKIEPTDKEILRLKEKNSSYGRPSLLAINIARAIQERLRKIR